LAHLLILGIGLVLSANPADTFGVSNHAYGLFLGKTSEAAQEPNTEQSTHTYLVPHGTRARVTCPRAFECSYGYCRPRWMPARRSRKLDVLWRLRGEVAGAVADTLCRSEGLWQSRWGR